MEAQLHLWHVRAPGLSSFSLSSYTVRLGCFDSKRPLRAAYCVLLRCNRSHKNSVCRNRQRNVSKMCKGDEEDLLEGMPNEYYDDEWQAEQKEKDKQLQQLRQVEDEEEERKIDEYREIGLRMKGYPEEDVRNARKLVSTFIRAAEAVEEVIGEAAERGELNELVLMVIWNRLDLARRDDEKDVIRGLDLLYRRVEMEILRREATPAMRLLDDLLNLKEGLDDETWLKRCKKLMMDTFPREDPFSILVPDGYDIDTLEGPLQPPTDGADALLRVDFVRELDDLLREVRLEQSEVLTSEALDPVSVASRLKIQEKQRAIRQVESLLDLAVNLN